MHSVGGESSESSSTLQDTIKHRRDAIEPAASADIALYDDNAGNAGLTSRKIGVLIAMSFLWTTSQIPLYFYGGAESQVLADIGGYENSVWIGLGQLLPLAIITPFVGSLSDLFGRKNVGIAAFSFVIVGNIVCALSQNINQFIPGCVLMGVGAGLGELVALAVTGEIAPNKQRGYYVGCMHATILVFCPAVLYAQLISYASTWRWVGLVIGLWSFIGLVLTIVLYKPRPRSPLLTRMQLARRIDYVGALLSAAGLTLFLLGLTYAADGDSWASVKVLAPFLIGICLIILFGLWEAYFVKYPMFPARLKQNPRILAIILLITFVSGANFFAVLLFWPTQYQDLYAANNAVSKGVGSLPVGFGIILGSMITTLLISVTNGRIRMLMIVATAVMTAGNGAMAAATLDNLPALYATVTIACIGVGAVIVPNQVIAGMICPPDLTATITAATITMRIVGGAIAYAIYWDIFQTKYRSIIPSTIGAVAMRYGIDSPVDITTIAQYIRGGGFELLATVPGVQNATVVEELTIAGRVALSESFPVVYYVSIGFGMVAFLSSWGLTNLKGREMDGNVAVEI